MKKILLINPLFYRLMGSHFNGLSLGLSYISSFLRNEGFETRIYNADFLDTDRYLTQEEIYRNYDEYKSILNDLKHPIWIEIKKEIDQQRPDIVGITMHTGTYRSVKNMASIIKDISKDIKVVVGGPHPTLDAKDTLIDEDNIDYVVKGEGEHTFLELIQGKKEDSILGLSYKRGKQVLQNPDRPFIENLDELPFPDRESIINGEKHDVAAIITGRGCPFTCTYCASPRLWKRQTRLRSIDNVLEELLEIKDIIGQRILYFSDDTFSLNIGRTKELCRRMIEADIKIKWKCDTRVDVIDSELIELMKAAGCVRVKIGAESGSDRILKMINKGIDKNKVRNAVGLIKRSGIPITAYLMAGFPGETNEDLNETIKFAEELDVDYYSVSILAPYYGTEIYHELERKGKMSDRTHWEYFFHQSKDMAVNDGIDEEVTEKFFNLNKKKGEKIRV